MNNLIYIRLDVDNVGDQIELSLLKNEIEKAKNIHSKIQDSIVKLTAFIESDKQNKLIMIGCDDILFTTSINDYNYKKLEYLSAYFFEISNFTLSIGVGNTIPEAMHNLKLAKLSGKNRIIEFQ